MTDPSAPSTFGVPTPNDEALSEDRVLDELDRHEPTNDELECKCGWVETLEVPPLNSFRRHIARAVALLQGKCLPSNVRVLADLMGQWFERPTPPDALHEHHYGLECDECRMGLAAHLLRNTSLDGAPNTPPEEPSK